MLGTAIFEKRGEKSPVFARVSRSVPILELLLKPSPCNALEE